MAETMYPTNPPPMPPEFLDATGDTGPGPIVDAMGGGMEAFAAAMQGGGDMEAAGQAFMDHMSGACANGDVPGVSPEMFEAVAEGFADVAGPAMMGLPADAGAADMGACFMDAAALMMPPGMEMPPEMGDMFGSMADTMTDCGVGPHDVGAEFGPPMPDGFVPGDPSTFPEGDYGPPPGDMGGGAMGGAPTAPPTDDAAGAGDMAGGAMGQPMGEPQGDMAGADGGAAAALGGAIGGGTVDGGGDIGAGAAALGGAAAAGGMAAANADPAAAADAAIGSAIDSAMEQGGAPTAPPTDDAAGAGDMAGAAGPEDEVDPSAGMG
jgi:hypothetical protein